MRIPREMGRMRGLAEMRKNIAMKGKFCLSAMTFMAAVCATTSALAAATTTTAPRRLAPGTAITIAFPEMPPTFCAVSQKKDVKAQMTIYLPRDYNPARKHPLLVFLNGGDGGAGGNPGVARGLSKEQEFICVNVPLFKAPDLKASNANAAGAGFIMVGPDGKYMWPFFKTMLEKMDETVPNIDPAHRILGGFSNGAHATAALIDESDGEVIRRFSAFLFVEGGGKLRQYDLLKGKPFLMVSSNSKSRPRAQEICDTAKAAGAKTTFICEDVGKHDFPASAYPAVRKWMLGPAME
ncbi:MAG: hypothetical protein NTX50_22710 [Candidatus Sumerlaeota bacterium]|nr:hypothetical protein [Candidatus Sumerlaeota bacterium]